MKTCNTFTAQIFVGLRVGYTDQLHNLDTLRTVCRDYVAEVGLCVTVTPTEFIYTPSAECPHSGEPGAIVGLINYPRFPSDADKIKGHAEKLAIRLKEALGQNRISIVYPATTVMS